MKIDENRLIDVSHPGSVIPSDNRFVHIVPLPNMLPSEIFLFSVKHPLSNDDPLSEITDTVCSTYFVIELVSTTKFDQKLNKLLPTPKELMLQQAKFVAALGNSQVGNVRKAVSLRIVAHPDRELPQRGKALIGFICRIDTKREDQAPKAAITFAEDFIRLLPGTEKQIYQYAPVSDETRFFDYFDPFLIEDVVEVRRREQLVQIGRQTEVYVVYPFEHQHDFVQLLWQLLKESSPHLIDISLTATKLLPWEQKGIENIIATCEMTHTETELETAEGDGRLRGVTRYNQSIRADEIRKMYRAKLHQFETQTFEGKIHLAASTKINTGLIEAIGVEVAGLPVYDPDDHNFGSGGYQVFSPLNSAEFERAINNIRYIEYEQWDYSLAPNDLFRLRQLYGVVEASCIFRIPIPTEEGLPGTKLQEVKYAPLPSSVPIEGIVLGESLYTGISGHARVMIKDEDRRRHMYIVGRTGTGKSTLMMQMAVSDIERGNGVCVIDPHGELIEEILLRIPPERAEDVILFDPSDVDRPIGLNMLETKSEAETHLVVNEMIGLMYKLYDPHKTGIVGPRFEHAIRNAMLTVMVEPGSTLIEVVRALTNRRFVQSLLPKVKDPLVRSYWTDQIAQTSDFHKSEVLDYIVSKFGRFVTNRLVRNIIGQSNSTFDYREVMDNKKIFLVNLSKGRIGPENSIFLGSIIVPKLLISALSRVEIPSEKRNNFYLYVDEFQNFASDTFAIMLSEARKYGICITMANQYLSQLPSDVRDSVFGNVGTIIAFRMGVQDLHYIEPEFYPVFSGDDIANLPKYTTCVKLLVDGSAVRQFSMRTLFEKTKCDRHTAELIRQYSRTRYGQDRDIVEAEINKRMH